MTKFELTLPFVIDIDDLKPASRKKQFWDYFDPFFCMGRGEKQK